MYLTLLPAYGRDYKSKRLIIDDLNNTQYQDAIRNIVKLNIMSTNKNKFWFYTLAIQI